MKLFIPTLVGLDETEIIGAYTSFDVALSKVEKALDELQDNNEDLGVYPTIVEVYLDDMDNDEYT